MGFAELITVKELLITYTACIMLVIIYKVIKRELTKEFIFKVTFGGYLVFVIGITLFPIVVSSFHGGIDKPELVLVPFRNWEFLHGKSLFLNIFGNLFLFTPIAFFGEKLELAIFSKKSWTLSICLILTFLIEAGQYLEVLSGVALMHRVTDITDVLLNMSGAVIGVLMAIVYDKFKARK